MLSSFTRRIGLRTSRCIHHHLGIQHHHRSIMTAATGINLNRVHTHPLPCINMNHGIGMIRSLYTPITRYADNTPSHASVTNKPPTDPSKSPEITLKLSGDPDIRQALNDGKHVAIAVLDPRAAFVSSSQ